MKLLRRLVNFIFRCEQKPRILSFTCATCPRMITLATMMLDEHERLVCKSCYANNASAEEIACVLHDLDDKL